VTCVGVSAGNSKNRRLAKVTRREPDAAAAAEADGKVVRAFADRTEGSSGEAQIHQNRQISQRRPTCHDCVKPRTHVVSVGWLLADCGVRAGAILRDPRINKSINLSINRGSFMVAQCQLAAEYMTVILRQ